LGKNTIHVVIDKQDEKIIEPSRKQAFFLNFNKFDELLDEYKKLLD
jgi:hypothetical protein